MLIANRLQSFQPCGLLNCFERIWDKCVHQYHYYCHHYHLLSTTPWDLTTSACAAYGSSYWRHSGKKRSKTLTTLLPRSDYNILLYLYNDQTLHPLVMSSAPSVWPCQKTVWWPLCQNKNATIVGKITLGLGLGLTVHIIITL